MSVSGKVTRIHTYPELVSVLVMWDTLYGVVTPGLGGIHFPKGDVHPLRSYVSAALYCPVHFPPPIMWRGGK